jgi:hypothetical protein
MQSDMRPLFGEVERRLRSIVTGAPFLSLSLSLFLSLSFSLSLSYMPGLDDANATYADVC